MGINDLVYMIIWGQMVYVSCNWNESEKESGGKRDRENMKWDDIKSGSTLN